MEAPITLLAAVVTLITSVILLAETLLKRKPKRKKRQ